MQALAFHNTQFDIVDRNGQSWLRSPQIAEALGYADPSSINRIYARHAKEFTSAMTGSVKLTDPNGDLQDTRIFSLRGAHLLGMFARTAVAQEFRRWVLDVLDREVGLAQAPCIRSRRWLLTFDHEGRELLSPIPSDAYVMTHKEVMQAMLDPNDSVASTEELIEFGIAILNRLKRTDAWQKQQLRELRKR